MGWITQGGEGLVSKRFSKESFIMTDEYSLDNEVSVEAAITETGIKGKSKSRMVAAIDRLAGNIFSIPDVYLDRWLKNVRIVNEGNEKLQKSAIESLSKEIGSDQELALRALKGNLMQSLRKKENKDGVVKNLLAITSQEEVVNNETEIEEDLSPDFMNRFERYAEDASTEEARNKWASILFREIRKPGSFSMRGMRIIDEIDAETASKFAKFCEYRIGTYVPTSFYDLPFDHVALFSEYDLIIMSSSGVAQVSTELPVQSGEVRYIIPFGDFAFSIGKTGAKEIVNSAKSPLIGLQGEKLSIPVNIATQVGGEIMGLVEDESRGNAIKMLYDLRDLGLEAKVLERKGREFFDIDI